MSETQNAWVRRVLGFSIGGGATDGAAAKDGPIPKDGYVVRLATAMTEWNKMRATVAQEVRKLQAAILAAHEGEDDYDEIEDNISNIDDILVELDDRLIEKLDDLRGAKDAGEKAKITDEARTVLDGYRSYLATSPLINDIDDNGYIPLAVKPLVESTLKQVAAAI